MRPVRHRRAQERARRDGRPAAMHNRLPRWVIKEHLGMSAATAAFPGSGRRLTPGTLPLKPCWSFSESRRMTMQDTETQAPAKSRRHLGTKASSSAPSRRYGQSTCGRSAPSSKSQTANATWRSSISKERQGVGDRAPEAGVAKQALGPGVRLVLRFAIGNNGSRSQSEALTAPPAARSRCPCEVRWSTLARAL